MRIPLQHWGATTAEIDAPMAGDDLIEGDAVDGTRAISIDAPRELVFDYLRQMGFGRAGWYSYDLLDNLGRRSADEINDEWLVQQAGEEVPGGPIAFIAPIVDRPNAYVLQVPQRRVTGHQLDFTLAYELKAIGDATRLVSRVRIAINGPLGRPLAVALLAGDGAMVRKQLLGIAERAERQGNQPIG